MPFKLNLGSIPLMEKEQKHFIELIYKYQQVFSLHNGDLGYCDKLVHSIPLGNTWEVVQLPHQAILPHMQSEVRKCLDTWLKQGVIHCSCSPFASQMVLVQKKTGEIHICVDFCKLNNMTKRDAFPLPRIEDALQAVQGVGVFCSINLAQGYLQVKMNPEDIQKTVFQCGSQGFFEFTRMPFGLSNALATFCRMMELCLGDQQYLTMLLYINDICLFAPDNASMLE